MKWVHLRVVMKWMALLAGLALLAPVTWEAIQEARLLEHLVRRPWHLAGMAVLLAVNLGLGGLVFYVVTLPFDARRRVPLGRMTALLAATTLLNYLPLKAGMIGRAAYLKIRYGLPLLQSVAIGLAIGVVSTVVMAVWVACLLLGPAQWRWLAALAGLIGLTLACRPLAQFALRRDLPQALWWVPLRAADVLVAAARLWLAFDLLGCRVSLGQALIFGAADAFLNIISITPNGLGLSEWVVGALARTLGAGGQATGAAAKLVDRAVHVVVVGVLGLWSVHLLQKPDLTGETAAGETDQGSGSAGLAPSPGDTADQPGTASRR